GTITGSLGQGGNTGPITLTAALAPAHVGVLNLESVNAITQNAAAALTIPSLAIQAFGPVLLDQANDVTTGALAANIDGAGQGFTFTDANDLTVGTADGVSGIATNGGHITVDTTTGNLTVNQNV